MGNSPIPNQLPVIRPLSRLQAPAAGAGEAFFDAFADSVAARLAQRLARAADLETEHHDNRAVMRRDARRAALYVAEAAEMVGISRALAYDLIRRNELPSVRLGRRILMPRLAIEQLLIASTPPASQ